MRVYGPLEQVMKTQFRNSIWNDWKDKGANFYQNINSHVYAKFIHDNSVEGTIDTVTLPFGYALSFDDVYNWSSEITSDQVSGDTQLERIVITVDGNSNI